MVGQCGETLLMQPLGGGVDTPAGQAVDDAGFAPVVAQKLQQLLAGVQLRLHRVADVRPVKAVDELRRLIEFEPLDDVGAGACIGGRGQRDSRDARETPRAA